MKKLTKCIKCGHKAELKTSHHLDPIPSGKYPYVFVCSNWECVNNDISLWCMTEEKARKLWKLRNKKKVNLKKLNEFERKNAFLEMKL